MGVSKIEPIQSLSNKDFAIVFVEVQSATTALWHVVDWCGTLEEIGERLKLLDAPRATAIANEIEEFLHHTTEVAEVAHLHMLKHSVDLFAETKERNGNPSAHGE